MSNQRKELRKKASDARLAALGEQTPQERIATLDARLGTGQGAKKERARLAKQIYEALT